MQRSPMLSWFMALVAVLLAGSGRPAWATPPPHILIVAGNDGSNYGTTAASHLSSDLGASAVDIEADVPGDLSSYDQIYDLRVLNTPVFTVGEENQYLAFLQAGTGHMIFLMGENAANFTARNTLISAFITLAGGGTVPVPLPANDTTAPETVNVPFNTTPNAISTVTFAAGAMAISPGSGTFICTQNGGALGGAIYFSQGTLANALHGGLVVVYDINFVMTAPSGSTGVNEIPFRQNMEAIIAGGGTALGPAATTVGLTSSQNPAAVGQSVTFTATVTVTGGGSAPTDTTPEVPGTPTGTVTFLDGTTVLGSGTLDAGVATYSTAALAAGSHPITARYSGSTIDAGSLSSALSQVVANAPVLVLNNPTPTVSVASGGSASVTLTVANAGAALAGPVTLSATGLPAGAACTLSSQSVDVSSGAVQVTALITTTPSLTILGRNRGLQGLPPMKGLGAGAGALLIGGVFALPGGRRRRRRMGLFLSALLVVLVGGLTACSSTSSGKGATAGTPTPAGTYTVAVTASATGATPVTTSIQLTVQ